MKLSDESMNRHLDALIASVDKRLATMRPEIDQLMEARHELSAASDKYTLTKTMFDVARPTLEQLYDEPTYNDVFVYGYDPRVKVVDDDPTSGGDLGPRRGAAFHGGEKYDEDSKYARVVFDVADRLGFVKKEVTVASDPLDRELGIADSDLEPTGRVEAVVVAGAAGRSNALRVRDAVRNIEQGRVETDKLIIATCDRKIESDEDERIGITRLQGGKTEFESAIIALNELAGTSIEVTNAEKLPVTLPGGEFEGTIVHQALVIGGREIDCVVVSSPFDPDRISRWKPGETPEDEPTPVYADRANTDETFIAVNDILSKGPGRILIESHDTWAIGQGVIAEQTFAVAGKDVLVTGPRRLDRVTKVTDKDGRTTLTLNRPEGVVDEIAKTYAYLTQTRIKAANVRAALH